MVVVAAKTGLRSVDVLAMTYGQHALMRSGGYISEDVRDVMNSMERRRWNIESINTHEAPWEQLLKRIRR